MSEHSTELHELEQQLRHHDQRYYRHADPEIPDSVYDDLRERYESLAEELGIPEAERYTAGFGDDHVAGFATVEHRVPMLSLEKLSPARRDSSGTTVAIQRQLEDWYRGLLRQLHLRDDARLQLSIEPKVDGISVSLLYRDGRLQRAATRGNGREGDDITAQVRSAGCVPEDLCDVDAGELEIRGELYLPHAAFQALNERLEEEGKRPLVNPRNGCAGLMKRKEVAGLERAGVRAFLYQIALAEGVTTPRSQRASLEWLHERGAKVYLDAVSVVDDVADALAACEAFVERREQLDFDIDGMVIKVDDVRLYDDLGATHHHPRWGIAYKFPPERKATRLLGVQVQVGKSGKLTPVAELEPVFIAGTTVSRASLHNFKEVANKDVRVGDQVLVEKAGEIIPQVVGVERERRRKGARRVRPPERCPACDTPVLAEEIFIYCPNPSCPAQLRERLEHFVSKVAMDIDGLGPALVDQLVDEMDLRSPAQLFDLDAEQLSSLERMGDKSAENVLRALEEAKTRGLERVLTGLSVRHLGQRTAEELAAYFGDADRLLAFAHDYVDGDARAQDAIAPAGRIPGFKTGSADGILPKIAEHRAAIQRSVADGADAVDALRAHDVPGLGQATAERLLDHFAGLDELLDFAERYSAGDAEARAYIGGGSGIIEGLDRVTAEVIFTELASPAVSDLLDELAARGVELTSKRGRVQRVAGVAGKTFVLTGTLPTLKRQEAASLIKQAGGRVSGSVSKKTDYVVAGEEPGSKYERAQSLGVQILDEAGLRELLAGSIDE